MKIKTRICSVILLILVLVLTLGFSSCKPTVKPDPDDPIVPPDDPVIPIIETDTLNITESGSYTINSKYVQINISAPNVTLTSGNVPFINITSGSVTLNSVTSARAVLKDNVHLIINENSNVTKVEVDGNNSSIELSHNLEELLVVESASNTSVKLNEANIGLVGLASKATFTGNGQILTVVTDNFSYYDSKLPVDYIAYQTPPYVSSGGSRSTISREKPVVQTDISQHTHEYVLNFNGTISCTCGQGTINSPYIAFLGDNDELLLQNVYLLSSPSSLPSGVTYADNTLSYSNTGDARKVVVYTDSANISLVINAPNDVVSHYGLVGVVDIQAIASSSYHEHDRANLIQIANGRLALESGAEVPNIHLTATDGVFNDITVAKASNVEMPDFSRDPVEIPSSGKLVVALQEGTSTNAEKDYVWLTAVGIYEQVTIGTAEAAGTDYAATSTTATPEQKATAQQIANNIIATIGEDSYTVTASYNTSTSQWDYNLVDENGDDTAFAVETVSVSVSEGSASASITVTDQNATAETSNNTNDTTEMVNKAKNTVVEVTFKGQKTLLGMSEFRDKWNNGDFYDTANPVSIKLVGNCNLIEENWGPIGTWEYPFFGTFDGNEKTISNLTNHAAAASNGNYTHIYYDNHSVGYGETYGFFGIVGGGNTLIKDVTFDSVNINVSNGKNVGAVIGYVPAQNSNFDNHVISTIGSLTLKGVKVTGSVQGKSHVSGLVGKIYTSGAISFTDCTNEASINGAGGYLGGLVGYASSTSASAEFINCKNTGNITGPTGNGAAGLIGKLIIASTGSTLLKDCSNEGVIGNTTNTNGSLTAGLANLGGAAAVIENCSNSCSVTAGCNAVVGVVFTDNIDVTLKGKITNSGAITQTNSSSKGDACGIIWVSNNKTLTVNNAIILNEGDIVSTKKAGGFQSSEQGVKFISIGTNSFENTGDISATCQNGFAYVGGVFGIMSGAIESKETMPFSINVHDCSITATGKGADVQYDANNMSWSCAGGVVGQIGGKGFVFNNVVVQNVSISAVGQNDNTYNYAGGFVGMIRMNAQENKVNTLTNATILTGNTINATHKGVIAGCSYDSQGGPGDNYNNALNYSGSFASGDALGQSWSEGTISLVE